MGDTIRYPNMGTVKKAAEIYGLSPAYIRPVSYTHLTLPTILRV